MLNPTATLAVILGVSVCPKAPHLNPLPQCANSALDFETYLRSSLAIPSGHIINLFNSDAPAPEQLNEIEDWLAQWMLEISDLTPTDLLIYYTGHGGFARNDQSYFLAINKTRGGSEGATSIRYVDLASAIKRHANGIRKYLILDCCFAASAVLKIQTELSQLVINRVEDELPPSGTAVLCSSAAKLVSLAPQGERHTMLSGALLQCLGSGVAGGPPALTLEDVGKEARRIIQKKYPIDAVRPELHVPDQARGNPATVPLFPNPMWKRTLTTSAEEPALGLGGDENFSGQTTDSARNYGDSSSLIHEVEPEKLSVFGKEVETRIVRRIYLSAVMLFLFEGLAVLVIKGDFSAIITFGGPAWAALAVARQKFGAPSRRLWRTASGAFITFISTVALLLWVKEGDLGHVSLSLVVTLACAVSTLLASSGASHLQVGASGLNRSQTSSRP